MELVWENIYKNFDSHRNGRVHQVLPTRKYYTEPFSVGIYIYISLPIT